MYDAILVLDLLLVDLSVSVVLGLVKLVANGILSSGGTGTERGIVILGDILVGFLGSTRSTLLDGLGDVVTKEEDMLGK